MLSKLILLLGAVIAGLIAYFCIGEHRYALTPPPSTTPAQPVATQQEPAMPQKAPSKTTAQANETIPDTTPPVPAQVVDMQTPTLTYRNAPDTMLSLHAGSADKTEAFIASVNKLCPPQECKQELVFDDNTNNAIWKTAVLDLIDFIHTHQVKDASISIRDAKMIIRGRFPDPETKKSFDKLLKNLKASGLEIEDQTAIFVDKRQTEETAKERPSQPKTIEVPTTPTPQTSAASDTALADVQNERIQSAQEEINTLLRTNPIYFERNSNKITLDSKAILDKIIDIVNRHTEEIARLRIAGHTDASGPAEYNKRLSRKRAESVRDYLIRHHIQVPAIEAVGYGEEQPISDNPYAKENRRVEITIDQGE